MARSSPSDPDRKENPEALSARLKAKYGEGVDPEVSLDGGPATSPTTASDELVQRLAQHTLKESRYQLEGEIARGGMGAILRVWDGDLRRHLAMKVILGKGEAPTSGGTPHVESHQLARFLEEAQVTGQLDHPGIVPVHELGLDGHGRVFFTMKLVKGRDLKHVFDLVFAGKDGWNETRALSVILRACEGMAYAHSKGVIHRDLKPANVMVGNFGEVYVMDWGLARVLGRKDSHDIRLAPDFTASLSSVKTERREDRAEPSDSPIVTMDGDVVGTPAYMPPEQARGEIEKLSARSDVYAIGAMLYHLLARQPPYVPPGARLSARTILSRVIDGPPTPLAATRPGIPAELAAIVEKAMARDDARRYPDTLALAEDLRAYLEHRVVGAYETGAWAEARKWVQRNKPLAAALAGAAALLVVGLTASMVLKAQADESARLAEERRLTAEENEKLAIASEERAQRGETQAKASEERAVRGEEQAKSEKANVLRLSAFETLDDLEQDAERLWPIEPELVPRYEAWLERASALLAEVPEHRAALVAMEQRALPVDAAELEAQRASHPRLEELGAARGKLAWMSAMIAALDPAAEGDAPADAGPEPVVNAATSANALNELAWPLVDPERKRFGEEARGLALARLAVERAAPGKQAVFCDTLAWALFATGSLDEAEAESRKAVEEAPEGEVKEYEGYVTKLALAIESWRAPDGKLRATRRENHEKLAEEVADLEALVSARREWRFEDDEDRWWHAQMEKLLAQLAAIADAKTGLVEGTSPEHGWGVKRRLEYARTVGERSVVGLEAKRLWAEAIAAIAGSPKYGGLALTPQLGLLPIGADPDSGLWEFAYLLSGDPAERGADGRLILAEGTGLVFVLIPGGTFWMGAQKTDESGRNYDPQAQSEESPVHEVTLSAYFLSKYEMTQGQWERFTGRNPSSHGPDSKFAGRRHNLLHPVEQVNWTQCMEVMRRMGLSLPSEAQWENGARGGTDTPWWTGSDRESLRGKVNLADQTAAKAGETWSDIKDWPDLVDGWARHAAVGSYAANAFGLHEVHGNVCEWCLDGFAGSFYGRSPTVDPVSLTTRAGERVYRGSGFRNTASYARIGYRNNHPPEYQSDALGLRPARASRLSASPLHRPGR